MRIVQARASAACPVPLPFCRFASLKAAVAGSVIVHRLYGSIPPQCVSRIPLEGCKSRLARQGAAGLAKQVRQGVPPQWTPAAVRPTDGKRMATFPEDKTEDRRQ